jgi:hypothetical protein
VAPEICQQVRPELPLGIRGVKLSVANLRENNFAPVAREYRLVKIAP